MVAIDRVRYVGEVIAAVAAEGRDIAEEALDLIEVEYEPLPAVFDPVEAMKPEAPILHTERAKAQSFPSKSGFRLEVQGQCSECLSCGGRRCWRWFQRVGRNFRRCIHFAEDSARAHRASCGGGLLGAIREAGDLHVDADAVIDTSPTRGAF